MTRETKYWRLILIVAIAELLVIMFSGVSIGSLYMNDYYSIGTDPFYWLVFASKIPQFLTHYQWAGFFADAAVISAFCLLCYNPFKRIYAFAAFVLALVFYCMITGYLGHRNFQSGYILILIPLLFKDGNRWYAVEAVRYFLLFFYLTSAIFKVTEFNYHGLADSNFLLNQFMPYYIEKNTGWRTGLNTFFINHPAYATGIYWLGVVAESVSIVGFFTRRYDRALMLLLLCFHLGNWIIMDIAPIGHLCFIFILMLSRNKHSNK